MSEIGYVELFGDDQIIRGRELLELADEATAKVLKLNQELRQGEAYGGQIKNLTELNLMLDKATAGTTQMVEATISGTRAATAAQKEYIVWWKQALNDRDKFEAESAKAFANYEKERANQAKLSAKETANAERQANAEKMQSDKEYQAMYLELLKERESAEKLAYIDREAARNANQTEDVGGSAASSGIGPYTNYTGSANDPTRNFKAEAAAQGEATAARDDAAASVVRLTDALQGQQIALKLNRDLYEAGTRSQTDYQASAATLTENIAVLKAELSDANAELKLQAEQEIAQKGSIDELTVSIKQLRAERDALDLTTEEGIALQKQLNLQIDQYNLKLQEAQDNLSKQKINIGNYPTVTAELTDLKLQMQQLVIAGEEDSIAFNQLALRAQFLTEAMGKVNAATRANVVAQEEEAVATNTTGQALAAKAVKAVSLESVGGRLITTFTRMGIHFLAFTLIAEGISKLVSLFTDTAEATDKASEAAQKYAKVIEDVNKGISEEVAKVNELAATAADPSANYKKRQDALDELQKLYPDYLKNLDREKALNGDVKDSINAVTDAIMDEARIKGRQALITAKYEELTKAQLELEQHQNFKEGGAYQSFDAKDPNNQSTPRQSNFYYERSGEGADLLKSKIHNLKLELQGLEDTQKKAQETAADPGYFLNPSDKTSYDKAQAEAKRRAALTKKEREAEDRKKPVNPDRGVNADGKADQDLIAANAETEKTILQQIIDSNKLILDDDNQTVDERVKAAGRIETAQEALAANAANTEILEAKAKIASINKLEADGKTRDKATLDSYSKEVEAQNVIIKNAQLKLNGDNAAAQLQYNNSVKKIYQDFIKDRIQDLQNIKLRGDAEREAELQDELGKLSRREISYEQYKKNVQAIDDKYDLKILQQQETYLRFEINFLKELGINTEALEKQLTAVVDAETKKRTKSKEDAAAKQAQIAQEEAKLEQQLFEDVANFAKQAGDTQFDNETKKLQDQATLAQQQHDDAVNLINAQVISQVDKDALIKAADAQLANAQKKNQQEQITLARRKAVFDKEIAITQIVENTAVAISKAIKDFGFPADIPIIAIQAAIGAAQVATVLAQPLPQYFTGIDSVPHDQFALTDERGPEMYVSPEGEISFGSNKANIKWLKKGTRVINAEDTAAALAARAPKITGQVQEYEFRQLEAAFDRNSNKIVRAIQNQPRHRAGRGVAEGFAAHITYIEVNFGANRFRK